MRISDQVHFVKKQWWKVGITETDSPQGGKIKVYDKERCICDLIRNKENVELQVYTQAITDYFKSNEKNIRRLLKYAELFYYAPVIMEVSLRRKAGVHYDKG